MPAAKCTVCTCEDRYMQKAHHSAFLCCQIWSPRQLQEALFAPHSLNGGWPSDTDLLELDAAMLGVKEPSNDDFVQLNPPNNTCWIRDPALQLPATC